MNSIINSEKVKKRIAEFVDKALNECAFQHNANGTPYEGYDVNNLNEKGLPTPIGLVQPTEEMLKFANSHPTKLRLVFEFFIGDVEKVNLFCAPIIDLTDLGDE
jgi:hypothetical protein